MSQFNIILNQVSVFSILMGLGYLFRKREIFSRNDVKGMSVLLMKVLMPTTVFFVIYDSGATLTLFLDHKNFFIITTILFFGLLYLGTLISKTFQKDQKKAIPLSLYYAFNNNNFFGLPIILSLFQTTSSKVNFSQFLIIDSILLWTIGVYLCNKENFKKDFFKQLKKSLNSMTLALLSALLLLAFKIELPSVITNSLVGFKAGSGTIAMFYVGCLLAETDYRGIFADINVYILVILKMILIPILIMIFGPLLLSKESTLILALLISMPGKVLVSIMVKDYNLDDYYSAQVIFATTLLALPIIPILTYLYSRI